SRGRGGGVAGSSNEDLHRPGRNESALRGESDVVESTDGRVGRWSELLSRQASTVETKSHQALRTVDGADLYRRQHRRRHRDDQPGATTGFLRKRPGATHLEQ